MRILSLLAASTLVVINAFAGNIPDDNQRHWEFNVAPQYVYEKINSKYDSSSSDKANFKGSTYGATVTLSSVMENNWYAGLSSNWHTGKLKADIITDDATNTDKFTNTILAGDLCFGYHFPMGQNLLDVGITPFVGVGYEYQKLDISKGIATELLIISPEYTRGIGLVGFMSNYNCNENFSIGLNATLRASFSSEVKDISNQVELGKIKNLINGSIEVPLGYRFQTVSMGLMDSINVTPFYNRMDWGRDKDSDATLTQPEIINKEYGVKLGLDLYF